MPPPAEPLTLETLQSRRAGLRELLAHDRRALDHATGATVTEAYAPRADDGPEVPLLIIRPKGETGPRPCILWIHGGGMVMGDRYVGMSRLVPWVQDLGVVAISVEYRLAPEHPHPAPIEDCYAALTWVGSATKELGIDQDSLILAGSSAGGGLAAGTALLARDRAGPKLAHQMLICPMLDDRLQTRSSHDCDGIGTWDRASSTFGWQALLGATHGSDDVSPYAAPARATKLAGLPPTFIDVGTEELHRDEVIDYATRLLLAGVPVELHIWPGGYHGFDLQIPDAALSRACRTAQTAYLRRVLQQTPTDTPPA